ncbi:hypothetical protein KDK95_29105 [Actinospica sp. MGRD01-02]|uniref:Uncharacterized protein n=1 Tax=Actinospica acidithermotolerans TaxID=2828514 RepID=A0A941ILV6_9ACTN|nr:hypothetical protein [Actinospica acidithermotolerans]MBR7830397.1 hypothetical protein [Actinospica acidithermotolerans]
MGPTPTAVLVGAAFGLSGVLIGPARIRRENRLRALRGLAIAFVPIAVWLALGGPILPTMLAFCLATLALGEWRLHAGPRPGNAAAGQEHALPPRRRTRLRTRTSRT